MNRSPRIAEGEGDAIGPWSGVASVTWRRDPERTEPRRDAEGPISVGCYDESGRLAVPFIPPMLATRLEDPHRLADPRYSAEPKLDGQRAQLH